jgi:long-subunit acyl-CoA synthetase (AMP-forming)
MNMIGYGTRTRGSGLDTDGWVPTDDIAETDADGFIKIIDRKKEIIISSAGKNMSPANIETAALGQSSLVAQVVAIGDGRRYVTALTTLDLDAVAAATERLGLPGRPVHEVAESPQLRAEIEAAVDRGNARLNSNEQIKNFTLLPARGFRSATNSRRPPN